MKSTEVILNDFFKDKDRKDYVTTNHKIEKINPQKIIGITPTYKYPDILNDRKTLRLKEKIEKFGGWDNDEFKARSLALIELPTGNYIVDGGGNHRAVLSKELGMTEITAFVRKLIPKEMID